MTGISPLYGASLVQLIKQKVKDYLLKKFAEYY